ncbi:MAG: DUF4270 family protein [Flavitalea sp.]
MKRNYTASLLIIFTVLFIYSSCTKIDSTDIGGGVIPAIDNINTFETTLNVISDNKMFVDTTRMFSGTHALGTIENDPLFGKTSAIIYTTFTPTSYGSHPFINKDSVTIDSMVLSLAYTQAYGDSNSVQNFEVREINPMSSFTDSLYLLNNPLFGVQSEVLGNATAHFQQMRTDSVRYNDAGTVVSTINELRIKLDTGFARRFVSFDTADAYHSDSAFKLKFKGLQIRPNEGASPFRNALAYFNLYDNARTKLTFYCRVIVNGKTDTIAPKFTYTGDAQANIILRTPANEYLSNTTNGTDNDEKVFIQSAPGSYTTVKIPALSNMPNSIIHRAELIADVYPTTPDVYTPPGYLFVDALSTTGDSAFTVGKDFVPDASIAAGYNQQTLGGEFRNNQYVLLLTRYVQEIVTRGLPNYTLRVFAPFVTQPHSIPNTNTAYSQYLVFPNVPVAAGRVVLYGGADVTPKRMRMRIIYSKI